jgi:hypothetical protein
MLTADDFPRLLAAVRELRQAILEPKSIRTEEEASNPNAFPDWRIIGDRACRVARILAGWTLPYSYGMPSTRSDLDPSLPVVTRAKIGELWHVVTQQDPRFGPWTQSPHTLQEVRDQLLVFLDGVAELLRGSRFGPCEGPDWDELDPKVRQLLLYMSERDSADLAEVCRHVWGKDVADVTEAARDTAIGKANNFLRKRECRQLLSKVRGEPRLRWK